MTDLEMLLALLNKANRKFDMISDDKSTVVQIHCFEGRLEFNFDSQGNLEEEWDNSAPTTWLTGGAYYD